MNFSPFIAALVLVLVVGGCSSSTDGNRDDPRVSRSTDTSGEFSGDLNEYQELSSLDFVEEPDSIKLINFREDNSTRATYWVSLKQYSLTVEDACDKVGIPLPLYGAIPSGEPEPTPGEGNFLTATLQIPEDVVRERHGEGKRCEGEIDGNIVKMAIFEMNEGRGVEVYLMEELSVE